MSIAKTPKPPYYAVIFTSKQSADTAGYSEMATRMVALAEQQPGYLGIESARDAIGITVSYWRDLESIKLWKNQAAHLEAQATSKQIFQTINSLPKTGQTGKPYTRPAPLPLRLAATVPAEKNHSTACHQGR